MLDRSRRAVSVDGFESIESLHGLELFLDQALILDKAAVHAGCAVHVHPGLPVIEDGVFSEITLDENSGTYRQIKDCIRNKCDAVYIANPFRFNTTHNGARHQRIDVSV